MDRATMLALMDRNMAEMYREMTRATPGGWIVERTGLVVLGSPGGSVTTNMAIVTGAVSADVVRAETDRWFRSGGLPFSVWTRAHADGGLEAALRAAGFFQVTETPGMVFVPGAGRRGTPPADTVIQPVCDDAGREAFGEIMAEAYAVYGTPPESTREKFVRLESVVGPTTQAYLAVCRGEPVAGAILYLSHGIGGIGWVGTRPRAFGRGYGTAVTWEVIEQGLARGVPFLSLQASPMGAPVYARMGFTTSTHYHVFVATH
jgi:GNAT superfamily N-acetyltransferase